MALMTPDQYEASLKKMKPRVFMNGKKVDSILENKNTRTVVESNKASYAWALDPRYKDIMTCYSPLIGEVVNRYTYLSASLDEVVKKAQAGTFTSEMLGTSTYRCVGYDAFHSLASTTWEMDRDLGTKYYPRFIEFLKTVQKKDLSVAGALTEPRGKRNQKTSEWSDPHLSLKLVERKKDGIVVRGAKINISGAYAAHELVVLPQSAHSKEEADYAVAFAIPPDTQGITFVAQYTPFSAEREMCDAIETAISDLGAEVTSRQMGESVMDRLRRLHPVAFVRFANAVADTPGLADRPAPVRGRRLRRRAVSGDARGSGSLRHRGCRPVWPLTVARCQYAKRTPAMQNDAAS